MRFIKRYWYLLLLALITGAVGIVVFLTSQKLEQTTPVAPTVPQATPKAVAPNCTLTFAIAETTTGTPTPTPTPTSTPTPTPTANKDPDCTGLTVSPNSGTAVPLAATLTCTGLDVDGDITAAEFVYGDGKTEVVEKNVGSPGSLSISHTYTQLGSYGVSCRVRDNNFKYSSVPDACKKTLTITPPGTTPAPVVVRPTVTSTPGPIALATPTPIPTPKVPVAGTGPSVLGASVVAGGLLLLLLGLAY